MKAAVSPLTSTAGTTRVLFVVVAALLSCASAANQLSAFTSRLLQKISGVPDDVYHCNHLQDSQWLEDDNVDCLEDKLWDTDRLDPNNPPDRCRDFTIDNFGDTEDDWGGWYEPCVLWEMMYGELQPTAAPSPATLMITPFQLTLVVPSGGSSLRRASSLEVDRDEWKELTEIHLLNQQLESASMVQLGFISEPIMTQDSNKSVMISQIFRGVVYYDDASATTTNNVDSMVASSFVEPALLSDYTLLLQQAKDPVLSSTLNVKYAVLSTNNGSSNSSTNAWKGVFIAGCVMICAGIALVVAFVVHKPRRNVEKEEKEKDDADTPIKDVDRTMDESFEDDAGFEVGLPAHLESI